MTSVADRYLLGEVLSTGGMAQVSLARLRAAGGFGRTVAIKKLHPQLASDPSFVAMMLDEARLVSRIRHPNVVVPLDVVQEDGDFLLVLEYVHGATLSELAAAGPCPLPIGRAIVAAVLAGLHAAHVAKHEDGTPLGVVHRDVSPHNVIVGADGDVRVLDFGVARAAGAPHQSEIGAIKGKVAYMAPEQLAAGDIGAAADQYGASVVAWELFTGRRLFEGVEKSQIPFLVTSGAVRSPSVVAPDLPEDLVDVIMRGLSRRPEDRFASAEAMAAAIEATGPVATPRELSAWVGEVARDVLAAKAAKVARLEQLAVASPAPTSRPTQVEGVSEDVPPVDRGRARKLIAILAVATLAGAAAALASRFVTTAAETRAATPAAPSDTPAASASTAETPTVAAPAPASAVAGTSVPSLPNGATAPPRDVRKDPPSGVARPVGPRPKTPRVAPSANTGLFDRN